LKDSNCAKLTAPLVDLTPQNGSRQVCQYDIPAFIHWISVKKIAIYCPELINTNAFPNVYEQAHCVKKINCFKQNHAVWHSNQEVRHSLFPQREVQWLHPWPMSCCTGTQDLRTIRCYKQFVSFPNKLKFISFSQTLPN